MTQQKKLINSMTKKQTTPKLNALKKGELNEDNI